MDKTFLVLLHPLNDTNYFKCKARFNGVFARFDLLRIKDGAYAINLVDKNSKGTHWVSLFIQNLAVYFDSFVIEYILQEVL